MEKWLTNNYNEYKDLISSVTALGINKTQSLYRIRISAPGTIFTPHNLFHVPFELRHTISTQRFSIPGYPCLYAGASLFGCWKEMDCPSFDYTYSIRLKADYDNIRIFDVGITPKKIAEYLEYQENQKLDWNSPLPSIKELFRDVTARMFVWPLQATSMIKVLHKDGSFIPEYIVPQLLLQYIKEVGLSAKDRIHGIRYFSIPFGQKYDNTDLGCNYVFPVQEILKQGYCPHLVKLFKTTEVLPWQVAPDFLISGNSRSPSTQIELVKEFPTFHNETRFGKMEEVMLRMPESYLS